MESIHHCDWLIDFPWLEGEQGRHSSKQLPSARSATWPKKLHRQLRRYLPNWAGCRVQEIRYSSRAANLCFPKNAPRLFHLCFLSSKNALVEARGWNINYDRGEEPDFIFTEILDNYLSPLPPVDWIFKKCPFSAIYAQYFEKCPYAHRKKQMLLVFEKCCFCQKEHLKMLFVSPVEFLELDCGLWNLIFPQTELEISSKIAQEL